MPESLQGMPPRCLKNCPVITSDRIQDYPLFPTRNCRGPVVRDSGPEEKIYLSVDGAIDVEKVEGMTTESPILIVRANEEGVVTEHAGTIGHLVCRNDGINSSLDALIQAQKEKKYPEIETKPSYWMIKARELFLDEYEDSKHFYGKYTEATDFYYELAKRVTPISAKESEAYSTMYTTFMEDAKNNNHEQLDELIALYKELNGAEE